MASLMRRYHVTTFGCQMNAHDSERIKGMLESLGLGEAARAEEADVVVFNTCTVREKPDTRLAAYLGNAAARKRERPDLVDRRGWLLCGGTTRPDLLPAIRSSTSLSGPGRSRTSATGSRPAGTPCRAGSSGRTSTSLLSCRWPRDRRHQAWVQVSMGCNSKCAYCIVPAVRGREQSRRPGEIVAEVASLAADGIKEITLLGQNVNSWGRDLAPEVRTEFGELLRACDAVPGIERIRFTSPHPKDFRAPVIDAIAECEASASTFIYRSSRARLASSS